MSERSRIHPDGLYKIITKEIALPDGIRSPFISSEWFKMSGFIVDGDTRTGLTTDSIDEHCKRACPEENCHFIDARREGENYRIAIRALPDTEMLQACVRSMDIEHGSYGPWEDIVR